MNFSGLSNDQLLQLMKAVLTECINRGVAMATAANNIGNDAVEEMLNKANASQSNQNLEGERAAVVVALSNASVMDELCSLPFSVNIWEKNGDRRVYIQESFNDNGWKITYYHTGNRWNRQGSLTGFKSPCKTQLVEFCRILCERYPAGFKAYSGDAEKYQPNPTSLTQYQQLLQVN